MSVCAATGVRRASLIASIALCAVVLLPPAPRAGQDSGFEKEIESTTAALAAEGVSIDDDDFAPVGDEEPPKEVTAAGYDFVDAWREYRRALSLRKVYSPAPQDGSNATATPGDPAAAAADARGRRDDLIKRLLAGDDPPTPEEVDAALGVPETGGRCGTGAIMFEQFKQRALLLANLRHRRFGNAVEIALAPDFTGDPRADKSRAQLLTALGFDWRQVVAGAWLASQEGMLESICKDADDDSAELVLDWAELHWDAAVAQEQARKEGRYRYPGPQPEMPTRELLYLLAPDNGVSADTKERVADFVNANATRLYSDEFWMSWLPAGAGSWVKPLARGALANEKNKISGLAAAALRTAGEPAVRTQLRADPMYRVLIDGEVWPAENSNSVGVSVMRGGGSGLAGSVTTRRDGIITVDADDFAPLDGVRLAWIYGRVDGPDSPSFDAAIPLPPAFGEITDLHVETTTVTIRPRLPRSVDKSQNIEISLDPARDDGQPNGREMGMHPYPMPGKGPLLLTRVQSRDYWLRVRAPGAALPPWEKVHVTGKAMTIEPKLEIGATVTVPLSYSGTRDESDRTWRRLNRAFTVERNGVPMADASSVSREDDRDELFLPNLPTGQYTVNFHPEYGFEWKDASLSFKITPRSPAEITLPPLKIISNPD